MLSEETLLEMLKFHLPQVTMIQQRHPGPLTALTAILRDFYGYLDADCLTVENLTSEKAKEVHDFCSVRAFGSAGKLVEINLDNCNPLSLQTMLKLLEEPPESIRFILFTYKKPLSTVFSRAIQYRVANHSVLSRPPRDESVLSAINVLKSIAERDADLMNVATSNWGEEDHYALKVWCLEALSKRWKYFKPGDSFGVDTRLDVCKALFSTLFGLARPRIAIRAGLNSVIQSLKAGSR